MQVFKAMQDMHDGEYLEISVTDPGFTKDISSWCEKTGNTLVSLDREENSFRCLLKKGRGDEEVSKQDLQPASRSGNAQAFGCPQGGDVAFIRGVMRQMAQNHLIRDILVA